MVLAHIYFGYVAWRDAYFLSFITEIGISIYSQVIQRKASTNSRKLPHTELVRILVPKYSLERNNLLLIWHPIAVPVNP